MKQAARFWGCILLVALLSFEPILAAFHQAVVQNTRQGAQHSFTRHLFTRRPSRVRRSVDLCASVEFAADRRTALAHADITWKLRPPPETPALQKLQWTVCNQLRRLQYQVQGIKPSSTLIFPNGQQAVLEAYLNEKQIRIGRFGILTQAGPSTPELESTVLSTYNKRSDKVRAAAIIYMFVEPEYRGRNVGALALQAIAFLHAARNCNYTILVANDKSRDKSTLVHWYQEKGGYSRAPALQEVLGSPNGEFGITMIAPTRQDRPKDCIVEWW